MRTSERRWCRTCSTPSGRWLPLLRLQQNKGNCRSRRSHKFQPSDSPGQAFIGVLFLTNGKGARAGTFPSGWESWISPPFIPLSIDNAIRRGARRRKRRVNRSCYRARTTRPSALQKGSPVTVSSRRSLWRCLVPGNVAGICFSSLISFSPSSSA